MMPLGRVFSAVPSPVAAKGASSATASHDIFFSTKIALTFLKEKTSSSAVATASKSTVRILCHPIVFTVAPKRYAVTPLFQLLQHRSSSSLALDRYRINGSKLYTQYILTLLALQLATEQSIVKLEQRTKHPSEWDRGADVLREIEEREVATYRAGLGKTAVARAFNAGTSQTFKNIGAFLGKCLWMSPFEDLSHSNKTFFSSTHIHLTFS